MTELIVVVTVIAMLASLLLPGVSLVKAAAQKSSCNNNLSQIALAVYGYASDNDNSFPVPYSDAGGIYVSYDDLLGNFDGRELPDSMKNASYVTIANGTQLNYNLKLYNLYRCPSETAWSDPTYSSNGSRFIRTYVPNRAYVNGGSRDSINGSVSSNIKGIFCPPSTSTTPNWGWAANFSTIKTTSNCIMLTEIRKVNAYLGGSNGDAIDNAWSGPATQGQPSGSAVEGHLQTPSSNYWTATSPLHGKSWNYLFCDGHVSAMRPEDTLANGSTNTAAVTTAGSMWWR